MPVAIISEDEKIALSLFEAVNMYNENRKDIYRHRFCKV